MIAEWKNSDPRFSINKRNTILILRPKGYDRRTSIADVETKHGWFVRTEFDKPYDCIAEGDDWPEDWVWIMCPKEII